MQNISTKKRCAVLGGSFNPPTRAHRVLMDAAMARLGTQYGVYVPSSEFYVNRKNSRNPDAVTLTEQERYDMLMSLCTGNQWVSRCEFGDTTKGRTLKTLREIQTDRPEMEPWFIIGCDKLEIFHKWRTCEDILGEFGLIWVGRQGFDFEAAMRESPVLSRYRDRQLFLPSPDGTQGISSSGFWKKHQAGDPAAYNGLTPEVADLVRKALA